MPPITTARAAALRFWLDDPVHGNFHAPGLSRLGLPVWMTPLASEFALFAAQFPLRLFHPRNGSWLPPEQDQNSLILEIGSSGNVARPLVPAVSTLVWTQDFDTASKCPHGTEPSCAPRRNTLEFIRYFTPVYSDAITHKRMAPHCQGRFAKVINR